MAKKASSKRMGAKPGRGKGGTYKDGLKALEDAKVPHHPFGDFKVGKANIDVDALEDLRQRMEKEGWSNVRFVALNAPFKRRSPISSA